MLNEKIINTDTENLIALSANQANEKKNSGRVDINHLIARVRKQKSDENRSNLILFTLFFSVIAVVGILLSL
jgi:hypothetical protein